MATSDDLRDRLRELRRSLESLPEVSEPPKPMLRILGSMRSEQKWNTLLAYFLDPSEPHGFGADLLTAFLDSVSSETDRPIEYYHREIETVKTEREITTPQNNRLDIVIRAPGAWFVWIEAKVDASEGEDQTCRYVKDPHVGTEEKADYLEGHHYVFLSKEHTADSIACEFEDVYWRHVVEAFHERLKRSHGQYPERSVSQLNDFLSTITTVTGMDDDDFTRNQKEKVQLLSEYRSDFDELLDAAEALRKRSIEEWPDRFRRQVDDNLWTDEWILSDEPNEWGHLFKRGWYLDDDGLKPTANRDETFGNTGFRLTFYHEISDPESFARGELTYKLHSGTRVPLRDEFHRLYNMDPWESKLESLCDEQGITNKGGKTEYTVKTYDVDQSGLPESYFETLATAFEEHIEIAETIDDILNEAVGNVKNR